MAEDKELVNFSARVPISDSEQAHNLVICRTNLKKRRNMLMPHVLGRSINRSKKVDMNTEKEKKSGVISQIMKVAELRPLTYVEKSCLIASLIKLASIKLAAEQPNPDDKLLNYLYDKLKVAPEQRDNFKKDYQNYMQQQQANLGNDQAADYAFKGLVDPETGAYTPPSEAYKNWSEAKNPYGTLTQLPPPNSPEYKQYSDFEASKAYNLKVLEPLKRLEETSGIKNPQALQKEYIRLQLKQTNPELVTHSQYGPRIDQMMQRNQYHPVNPNNFTTNHMKKNYQNLNQVIDSVAYPYDLSQKEQLYLQNNPKDDSNLLAEKGQQQSLDIAQLSNAYAEQKPLFDMYHQMAEGRKAPAGQTIKDETNIITGADPNHAPQYLDPTKDPEQPSQPINLADPDNPNKNIGLGQYWLNNGNGSMSGFDAMTWPITSGVNALHQAVTGRPTEAKDELNNLGKGLGLQFGINHALPAVVGGGYTTVTQGAKPGLSAALQSLKPQTLNVINAGRQATGFAGRAGAIGGAIARPLAIGTAVMSEVGRVGQDINRVKADPNKHWYNPNNLIDAHSESLAADTALHTNQMTHSKGFWDWAKPTAEMLGAPLEMARTAYNEGHDLVAAGGVMAAPNTKLFQDMLNNTNIRNDPQRYAESQAKQYAPQNQLINSKAPPTQQEMLLAKGFAPPTAAYTQANTPEMRPAAPQGFWGHVGSGLGKAWDNGVFTRPAPLALAKMLAK